MVHFDVEDGRHLTLAIDFDIGLEPGDAESVLGRLSPNDLTSREVRVDVHGPTTDHDLLGDFLSAIDKRLREWGKTVGMNIHVPSP